MTMAVRQSRAVARSIPSFSSRYYASTSVSTSPSKVVATKDMSNVPGMMGKPVPTSSVDKIHPPLGKGYKSQGTSIGRTIRNIWKAGWKRAFWQIKEMNDTKVGVLIGTDHLGNKYYEDMGELPLRERWVEYAESHEYDSTQIEPGWHAWMTYMTNEPPTIDPKMKVGSTNPKWEVFWRGTVTQTDGAYRPYSTVKHKYQTANLTPRARE